MRTGKEARRAGGAARLCVGVGGFGAVLFATGRKGIKLDPFGFTLLTVGLCAHGKLLRAILAR